MNIKFSYLFINLLFYFFVYLFIDLFYLIILINPIEIIIISNYNN